MPTYARVSNKTNLRLRFAVNAAAPVPANGERPGRGGAVGYPWMQGSLVRLPVQRVTATTIAAADLPRADVAPEAHQRVVIDAPASAPTPVVDPRVAPPSAATAVGTIGNFSGSRVIT